MAVPHPRSWSLPVGSWHQIPIRIHAHFLVFCVATLFVAWMVDRHTAAQLDLVGVACLSVAILLLSVLVHGLAHLGVAEGDPETRLPRELVIGPLGELSSFDCLSPDLTPATELRVALAGPAANLCLALVAGALLRVFREPDLLGLLHPLAPVRLIEGPWGLVVAKLTLWINWMLLCTNLFLPVLPLDGKKILRSMVAARWPDGERALPSRTMVVFAHGVCLLLVLTAWIVRSHDFSGLLPTWSLLTLVAVFIFLGTWEGYRREIRPEAKPGPTGDGSSIPRDRTRAADYSFSAEAPAVQPVAVAPGPWCGACATDVQGLVPTAGEHPQSDRSAPSLADEQRLDEILIRVHQGGLEQLTPAERTWLAAVSARLRERMEKRCVG